MTPHFHALCVDVSEMPTYWFVGFADKKVGTNDYVMLQRGFENDEEEIALGMDTYYIERNDQGSGGYGEIAKFELFQSRVVISFTEVGADRMDGIATMDITFEIDDAAFLDLQTGLERIFAGADCYQINRS
jgi:hypothetical protein